MKGHQNMLGMMSIKHFLVVSLALNVGLISKILFIGDRGFEESYCFGNKEDPVMVPVSREEKHVEKKDAGMKPTSDSFSPTSTAAHQDDGSIINLDQ